MRQDYDYNIYAPNNREVGIYAYKQMKQDGLLRTDTSHSAFITFNISDNMEEVSYLLDLENPEDFADYDSWVGLGYLTQGKTPASILEWLESLPPYIMREVTNL